MDDLRENGFEGFDSVAVLRSTGLQSVPKEAGVYLSVWAGDGEPTILAKSSGGWFKGRDPTQEVALLQGKWVKTSPVIYIGKAGGLASGATLRSRLRQYLQFGSGKPCGHWGGRYTWQLKESSELLICWKGMEGDPRGEEKALLQDFMQMHGQLPFANCVA
jgi:hypothetical protein